MSILDGAGLEENKKSHLREKYKFQLGKRGKVAIGISKEDCSVKVIRSATE